VRVTHLIPIRLALPGSTAGASNRRLARAFTVAPCPVIPDARGPEADGWDVSPGLERFLISIRQTSSYLLARHTELAAGSLITAAGGEVDLSDVADWSRPPKFRLDGSQERNDQLQPEPKPLGWDHQTLRD
jgi:hypothetical protein